MCDTRRVIATWFEPTSPGSSPTPVMRWVPAGTLLMDSEDFYPEGRPVHRVEVPLVPGSLVFRKPAGSGTRIRIRRADCALFCSAR